MQCKVYAQCKQATIICHHESSQRQKHNSIFLTSVFYCRLRKDKKNLLSVVKTNIWRSYFINGNKMPNFQVFSVFFSLYLDFHAVLFSLRLTTFFLVGLPLTPIYLVTSWRVYFTQLFLF